MADISVIVHHKKKGAPDDHNSDNKNKNEICLAILIYECIYQYECAMCSLWTDNGMTINSRGWSVTMAKRGQMNDPLQATSSLRHSSDILISPIRRKSATQKCDQSTCRGDRAVCNIWCDVCASVSSYVFIIWKYCFFGFRLHNEIYICTVLWCNRLGINYVTLFEIRLNFCFEKETWKDVLVWLSVCQAHLNSYIFFIFVIIIM